MHYCIGSLVVEGVAQWGVGITYCRGREIYRGKAERENEKKEATELYFCCRAEK